MKLTETTKKNIKSNKISLKLWNQFLKQINIFFCSHNEIIMSSEKVIHFEKNSTVIENIFYIRKENSSDSSVR